MTSTGASLDYANDKSTVQGPAYVCKKQTTCPIDGVAAVPINQDQTNGVAQQQTQDRHSVTKQLAAFVYSFRIHDLNEECLSKLKMYLLDYIGVTASAVTSAESSLAFYKAVTAIAGSQTGTATVIAHKTTFPPQYAALLNGAYAHSLDFDDTYADGRLHPGVSVISAALAQAEADPSTTTEDLLAALAVGYEVVCRLSRVLGPGAYERGFHNTGTAGIFGATAAIANLKRLSSQQIENAFGLSLSKAAGSMQYLANGSWNKRLHPGFAAHDAFLCAALAEAGVLGATEPIEGKFGLLHAYSADINASAFDTSSIVRDLGTQWVFLRTAIKPFPACRATHGAIQAASSLSHRLRQQHPPPTPSQLVAKVRTITLRVPHEFTLLVAEPLPHKIHPTNHVDAQFSIYYQAAVAFLHGASLGWAAYALLHDPDVHALTEKITVRVDEGLSGLESGTRVEWADDDDDHRHHHGDGDDADRGEVLVLHPLGEPESPLTWPDVLAKFHGLAAPVYGEERCARICAVIADLERSGVWEVMGLLRGI